MADLRTLRPELIPYARWFVRQLEQAGIDVTVTSATRGLREQQELWNCYQRTGCSNCGRTSSCYPAAPPGSSPHGIGIAFDLHLEPPRYDDAGALWEAMGLRWGGRFRDRIHFDFYRTGYQPPRVSRAS